ncbi:acyl-ACP--UDP-N-acetylglucosamine O-acyltransferase [Legionella taurinensis]|uniref:Acyl-[acyl-carrier-protein]--UDP-N-acetylglucosamine O-acyltransferase n=1 Tax=Legionella taurinensis TaxID=70611 RepID=A0A3A5L342_9GAMM|nr:acyl-ACP--UDP-N-acetylglucosamine O-acyltransferase [Legionella taurinensis]MDX1836277.1 acyl-ACP--UDP-N-acetylglucosamine O-acyltransferase [Legionella taurinensis]PUT42187.1 acyl-[acyl-carrier-protein]--UDP-N-acetylglucosamine O-acyltransferase [Legionella taurinensis]PUT44973.1 acyl-[acyl-carrier-protein]--UDP-N-acetylglucosamine O-acyltransferase [Legionella taurinensis]PUT48295.1 acyl-[acyl-carrier-protein]--UDP-N-acetylglucosamine O-acyltransferase [Legionella taurinensis]PUT49107.1 a
MQMSQLDQQHVRDKVIPIHQQIHPTALIAQGARIGSNVSIGPFSVIGEHVAIGANTVIGSHVVIEGWTTIGERNQIYTGAVIGSVPQDLKFNGEKSFVSLGNDNIVREYVTISRGTAGGGSETRIGNANLLMTGCHVAHDVQMGNHNVIANTVAIAGHVIIEDWVTVGGVSGIHQFSKLGSLSMVGAKSYINKDVPPFALVQGNPAKLFGVNIERLRRNQFKPQQRLLIQRAYKILHRCNYHLPNAIAEIEQDLLPDEQIACLLHFLRHSERGICRGNRE